LSEGATIWYRVRDLDAARQFYTGKLGFTQSFSDEQDGWTRLERDGAQIALAVGEPEPDGAVAHVDVGVVLELHGEMRLLDVRDPDGNRIELGQELEGS
jgi:catechol 2,3-dioxygenase-like lactoylglutathione lyase family enzyme